MPRPLPPAWAGRLTACREGLDRYRLDALVVSSPPNLRYLSGFTGSAGLLVVTPSAAIVVADGRYASRTRQGMLDGTLARDLVVEPVPERYDLALATVLGRLGVHRAGFEAGAVTVATLGGWHRAAPDVEFVQTDDLIEALRAVKDAGEIAIVREAARRLSGVARDLPRLVRRGATERDVARAIDLALDRAGFERPAFDTIVASGPNSAHPHATPGTRVLADGDLVVLDFGGVLDGYCVDLTRMAAIGAVPARALELVDAVRAAEDAAIAAVAPGMSGAAIDEAARAVLDERGLGEGFLHGTGHGLGLEVHELPRISRFAGAAPLAAGMICTIEPGVYIEGLGGARLEDDVLVTDTGQHVLTDAPRDLVTI